MMEARKENGLIIAKNSRITNTLEGWKVPSQSGKGEYIVEANGAGATCTCQDFELRQNKCKHIWAAEFVATKVVDQIGKIPASRSKKKTYSQNWKSYNLAQQREKLLFMMFLSDLTNRLKQPSYGFGRPTLPLSDMVYSMVFKVYSMFSGRRFTSDMQIAEEQGYISKKPHFNSLFNYFRKEELTPMLAEMVTLTSLPLKEIEKYFGIDSKDSVQVHFRDGIPSNMAVN